MSTSFETMELSAVEEIHVQNAQFLIDEKRSFQLIRPSQWAEFENKILRFMCSQAPNFSAASVTEEIVDQFAKEAGLTL